MLAVSLPRWLLLLALLGFGCAPPVPIPLTPAPAPAIDPGLPAAPPVAETWTVRLLSTADATEAEEFASQAQPRFDAPLSIVRSGGESHVQVGRFSTPEAAAAFLQVARERGYRLAAVVHSGTRNGGPPSEDPARTPPEAAPTPP